MTEEQARALIAQLTHEEMIILNEFLKGLEQERQLDHREEGVATA